MLDIVFLKKIFAFICYCLMSINKKKSRPVFITGHNDSKKYYGTSKKQRKPVT